LLLMPEGGPSGLLASHGESAKTFKFLLTYFIIP
jgi:hypothetical protein